MEDYRVTTLTGVFILRSAFIIGDGIAGTLDSGASYSLRDTEYLSVEPIN